MKTVWVVKIIESERGWGQRIDEEREFESYENAVQFVKEYNKDNNEPTVPDWYMYAVEPVARHEN